MKRATVLQLMDKPTPADLPVPVDERREAVFDHVLYGLSDVDADDRLFLLLVRRDGDYTDVRTGPRFWDKLIKILDTPYVLTWRWLRNDCECPCSYCRKWGKDDWRKGQPGWHLHIDLREVRDGPIVESLDCGVFFPRTSRCGARAHRTWNVRRDESMMDLSSSRHRP